MPSERVSSQELSLAKALSHPLRQRLLQQLSDRVASPVELAREVEEPLNLVSYHVRVLEQHGMVELVRTRPRRGATEHFYRAAARLWVEDDQWIRMPEAVRRLVSGRTLAEVFADAAAAGASGAFEDDAVHVSRTLLELDHEGWHELSELLIETLRGALRIQDESRHRLQGSEDASLRSELAVLHFARTGDDAAGAAPNGG
jgi:DNA-binding transcriptional ArsR family regulator